jgi:hypothetical protein
MAGVIPVTTLKRGPDDIDLSLCLFCQGNNKITLSLAKDDGKIRVQEVAIERRKLKDTNNMQTIDRIFNLIDFAKTSLLWHKGCYTKFTAEDKLNRLRKKASQLHTPNPSQQTQNDDQPRTSRS